MQTNLFPNRKNLQLDKCADSPQIEASHFRRLVGHLLYLQATRSDTTHDVYQEFKSQQTEWTSS